MPHDSDAKVAGALFAMGAVIGVAIALVLHSNGGDAASYWPLSLAAGAVLGVVVPWPLVRRLGKDYLDRARLNLEQGRFKEAMQDAAEVERISEVYKSEAIEIKEYARQQRDEQIAIGNAQPVSVSQSTEGDPEFAEFLSSYTPGSL
ncbi:ZIP family metal transporter [Aeoliella sp. ICT_H6.2]|uniref:ZIP family metal transporter n=1 Tax=Aeoliella straminimaris TaxID=2954799 RepID=A0A9X2FER7_9BACT|nr:ZIP family metal transporter [Aeoliella straminimaris]MCO6044466.1 ZIP family metal transporter [Aeoliella straminimaris]